jgi:hypothetical protein
LARPLPLEPATSGVPGRRAKWVVSEPARRREPREQLRRRNAIVILTQALDALTAIGGDITAEFKASKDLAEQE